MILATSPLTLLGAHEALERADDRDAIFAIVLRAIRDRADWAGLFAVRGDAAVGRLALEGDDFDKEEIARLTIPMAQASCFRRVVESVAPYIGPIATTSAELDAALGQVCGTLPSAALLLPIPVGNRVVAIAVGHRLDRGMTPDDIAELLPITDAAAQAISRLIVKSKTAPPAAKATKFADQAEAHAAAGRWKECIDSLRRRARVTDDEAIKLDSVLRAAEIWDHELHNQGRAILAYRHVLRIAPGNRAGSDRLEEIYRAEQSWQELCELLVERASHTVDRGRRMDSLRAAATIYEAELGDRSAALSVWLSALREDFGDEEVAAEVERLAEAERAWGEILVEYWDRAEKLEMDQPAAAARLWTRIGRWYRDRLLADEDSVRAFERARSLAPTELEPLEALDELYDRTGQAEKYLDVIEAKLDLGEGDDDERADKYREMAAVWEDQFDRPDRATDCLRKLLSIRPREPDALRELCRLLRHAGNWRDLVDACRAASHVVSDPAGRVKLLMEAAELCEKELSDPARALELYRAALSIDREQWRALDRVAHLCEQTSRWNDALSALERLALVDGEHRPADVDRRLARVAARRHAEKGDWASAAPMARQAADSADTPQERSRLLYSAARIYFDRLSNETEAKRTLEQLIAHDPDHLEGASRLADLYFAGQEWEPLAPLLDRLIGRASRSSDVEPPELAVLYRRAARCAQARGELTKAVDYYRSATAHDPGHLPTRVALAELLCRTEDWAAARTAYEEILSGHGEALSDAERVATFCQLGEVLRQVDASEQALAMFRNALAIDPAHPDSLRAVMALLASAGNYEDVIGAKRKLLAAADDRAKVDLLSEIGDLYVHHMRDPQRAIAAYREAVAVAPGSHRLLQKLLDLYSATESWQDVIETIERFIAIETDPVRRGAYHHAAAAIYRDELDQPDEALARCERALDEFFAERARLSESAFERALEAFRDLEKILARKRNWKDLERAYRRMIKRFKPGEPVLVPLWDGLGEIYRSHLDNPESALQAFEVARSLDPDNPQRNAILAELCAQAGPDQADKAIELHARVVRSDPRQYDSYHALYRLYAATQQLDKALCVANALVFLGQADVGERQFSAEKMQTAPTRVVPGQHLSEEAWRRVFHPLANRRIGLTLGLIWHAVASLRAEPPRAWGLRKKDRRDIRTDEHPIAKVIVATSDAFGMPLPDVYFQDREPGGLALANTIERGRLGPALVARRGLLARRSRREVSFIVGRMLAFLRPEHYLRLVVPTTAELEALLLSAIHVVEPSYPIPSESSSAVAHYAPELDRRLAAAVRPQLAVAVGKLIDGSKKPDMIAWSKGVNATSYRAGFIASGDLAVAARLIESEGDGRGSAGATQDVEQLVIYGVSEDYFAIRAHLGLAIVG